MKKLTVFSFLFFCVVLNSCDDKRTALSISRIYFNNNTNHIIKFLPYKNGIVITDSIKTFIPKTNTLFESIRYTMPPPESPTFVYSYHGVIDSVIVTFDDIKKEKHRFFKTYLPSKERSIYSLEDGNAFKLIILERRKGYIETEFTYTFTEQDYLDAEPN